MYLSIGFIIGFLFAHVLLSRSSPREKSRAGGEPSTYKQRPIREGKCSLGGVKLPPTTRRPSTPPKGQGLK